MVKGGGLEDFLTIVHLDYKKHGNLMQGELRF